MTDKYHSRHSRPWPAILAGIAALAVVAAIGLLPRFLEQAPAGPTIGGPFSLIDQTGRTVTDKDFQGKLLLIYFGYTFCPDVCPTTLGNMAQAYDMLTPAEQAQVVPMFITVDPERDTVDQIAQYVDAFSPAFVGLTGSPDQITPVLKEFRVYARKVESQDANYSVDHSSILYVMGKNGKYATHFTGEAAPKDIAAGVKKLLAG
ncbi:SCO family protein [Telmatospirillum siberiense]|uniref:SCO family protein n=1 Tax=Telmatospirillum siberiense TaxID=382514 RepID=A0A2N3PSM1_9PROT|nr:SCO family protein [Telmatospirillum siberiense]PKU23398.1 SCO family protein [Telmatospirillum siberiense]